MLGFNLFVNWIFFGKSYFIGYEVVGLLIHHLHPFSLYEVDTFLAFFRAYRDERGIFIYSLSRIRKNYIKSGWFFLNLLACIPGSLISHLRLQGFKSTAMDEDLRDFNGVAMFFLFELLKLLRLLRFRKLLEQSMFVNRIWETINVETALMLKFTFLIGLISHWIACLWGFIAFFEAKSFGDPMYESLNWISNWYNGSYVEGGLNPIGWENYLQRYWLCLFWAIQSITSIG
jgi:hypothetical protein